MRATSGDLVRDADSAFHDIFKTYQLHANCFITKPVDLDSFIHVVQQVGTFWLSIVSLPKPD